MALEKIDGISVAYVSTTIQVFASTDTEPDKEKIKKILTDNEYKLTEMTKLEGTDF